MPKRSAVAFTEAFIKSAAPRNGQRSAFYDALTPGLELRVSDGAKTWAFRYRDVAGRTLRLVLGTYPATSLKEARERALEARGTVSRGGDPQRDKRAAAAAARAQKIRSLKDLADSYLAAAEAKNRPGSVAVDRQRIESHIIPKLGKQQITAVSRAQVRELVNDIGGRGHAVTANRVAGILVKLYRHARDDLDMPVQNPATGLQSTFEETSRSRVLNDDELRALWPALQGPNFSPLTETMALSLRLCGLTLQRGQEVCGIDVRELHLDQRIWIIPPERTKNHREHVVPLSPAALAVINRALAIRPKPKERKRKLSGPLFPSPRDPTKPITRHALTRAMARLCDEIGIEDAGPHDLRRTGATNITSERIGMPRFVVSAVLNHVSEMGGITAVYDRNEYLSEKRSALEAWARLLTTVAKRKEKGRGRTAARTPRTK
jgi:integrase